MTALHARSARLLMALAALSAADSTFAQTNQMTVLFLESEPGDFIGGGRQHTLTPEDGTFTASSPWEGVIEVEFLGLPEHFWRLTFAPVDGGALGPGVYEAAERWPFQSPARPGLDVSGNGRGCNGLQGRYVIHELVIDSSGLVMHFAADFEQHCEGQEPALFGSIRINSAMSTDPRLVVGGSRVLEGDAGLTDATFSVFLTRPAVTAVDVSYATVDGTALSGIDYYAASGALTFAAGEIEKTVGVLVEANTVLDPHRGFLVSLESAEGVAIGFASGQGSILDDDGARTLLYLDTDGFSNPIHETHTVLDGHFDASSSAGEASFRFRARREWNIELAAPEGIPLVPGVYEDARAIRSPEHPRLFISGEASQCRVETGRFVIHEILVDEAEGAPLAFAADFDARCPGSTRPFFGSVRLNSAVPVTQQGPVTGDGNGDGWTDLFWRHEESATNAVLFMAGTAAVGAAVLPGATSPEWMIVGTADWNSDGRTDLLWRHRIEGWNAVTFMNELVPIGLMVLPAESDVDWRIVGTGRFRRDEWPDIVWRNRSTGENRVWYMNADGVEGFQALDHEPDTDWTVGATGDFNNDGRADIVWQNEADGANRVWFMLGASLLGSATLPSVEDTAWQMVGAGDFNRDGQFDLLWRHSQSGVNGVWFMKEHHRSGLAALPRVAAPAWRIVGPR